MAGFKIEGAFKIRKTKRKIAAKAKAGPAGRATRAATVARPIRYDPDDPEGERTLLAEEDVRDALMIGLQRSDYIEDKDIDALWAADGFANGSFNQVYFYKNSLGFSVALRVPMSNADWITPYDSYRMRSETTLMRLLNAKGVNVAKPLYHDTSGKGLQGKRYTIETKLTGSLIVDAWEQDGTGRPEHGRFEAPEPGDDVVRFAILKGFAREMAKIHKAGFVAHQMGPIDPDTTESNLGKGPLPIGQLVGLWNGEHRTGHVPRDIFEPGNRHAFYMEQQHDSASWRADVMRRWFDLANYQGLEPQFLADNASARVVLQILLNCLNDRIAASKVHGKETFRLGHIDSWTHNVFTLGPLRAKSADDAANCEIALIDWDNAMFFPQDRGYLMYPAFLTLDYLPFQHRRHFNADLHASTAEKFLKYRDVNTPSNRIYRNKYVEYLHEALGGDDEATQLVDTWTQGSHYALAFDDCFEKFFRSPDARIPHPISAWTRGPHLFARLVHEEALRLGPEPLDVGIIETRYKVMGKDRADVIADHPGFDSYAGQIEKGIKELLAGKIPVNKYGKVAELKHTSLFDDDDEYVDLPALGRRQADWSRRDKILGLL